MDSTRRRCRFRRRLVSPLIILSFTFLFTASNYDIRCHTDRKMLSNNNFSLKAYKIPRNIFPLWQCTIMHSRSALAQWTFLLCYSCWRWCREQGTGQQYCLCLYSWRRQTNWKCDPTRWGFNTVNGNAGLSLCFYWSTWCTGTGWTCLLFMRMIGSITLLNQGGGWLGKSHLCENE